MLITLEEINLIRKQVVEVHLISLRARRIAAEEYSDDVFNMVVEYDLLSGQIKALEKELSEIS